MSREQEIHRNASLLVLAGIGLIGVALFAPDAANSTGSFFSYARHTRWSDLLDFAAAWCSIKIMLLSIGVFLLIESTATLLMVRRQKFLAGTMFLLNLVPCLGMLCGIYYLIKSLL